MGYYQLFLKQYWPYVEENLNSKGNTTQMVISKLLKQITKIQPKCGKVLDDKALKEIPSLVAKLFAIWALEGAGDFFLENKSDLEKREALLQPHAGQVMGVFRMFGLGVEKAYFENNLVQISTGEGKSVVLGICSCLLALLGMDVRVACYSKHLSLRDFKDFEPLFNKLGVKEHIKYSTFNELCEDFVNEKGNVRDRVGAVIQGDLLAANGTEGSKRAKILLIDEVDVFFSDEFYGKGYAPVTELKGAEVSKFIQAVWNRSKSGKITMGVVKSLPEYQIMIAKYPGWTSLLEETSKEMLSDLRNWKHPYFVEKDEDGEFKIAYKLHDGFSFRRVEGYKTLWAYMYENEQQKISLIQLQKVLALKINLGSFSYSEIPRLFDRICGLSGTLSTMTSNERNILTKEYKIDTFTILPSVYGERKLTFAENSDITFVKDGGQYFARICTSIQEKLKLQRPCLVFFESQKKLMEFRNCGAFSHWIKESEVLTENSSEAQKKLVITKATQLGQITLATRSFGRGIDFRCFDPKVREVKGVHVIQTFLSEKASEETQIKGRPARQGDPGSFEMILRQDEDLHKFGITDEVVDLILTKTEPTRYQALCEKRNAFEESSKKSDAELIKMGVKEHTEMIAFLDCLSRVKVFDMKDLDMAAVKTHLESRNKGTEDTTSRILCVLDGTGSMYPLFKASKAALLLMFKRINEILKEKNLPVDCFELQIAIYRNYNVTEDLLLEWSSWEHKPQALQSFMDSKNVAGGLGNEAIEIGLDHAVREIKGDIPLSGVILIGDRPPNTKYEMLKHRNEGLKNLGHSKTYWDGTKYKEVFDFTTPLSKLKEAKIPVHAYFVAEQKDSVWNPTKEAFENIAKETGGDSGLLILSNKQEPNEAAELLTEKLAIRVLRDIGGKRSGAGGADDLEAVYLKKYKEGFT